MNAWIRPIRTGWVVRDPVGEHLPGPDVDEFADPDQVTAALAEPGAADGTLLAVQHPHRTPAALAGGLGLQAALPIAHEALNHLRASHYRRVNDVVALSWGDQPGGAGGAALGLMCVVDPAAVNADGLAFVRHTEEVYPEVVAERAAMLSGLGCATSAAMLVPADGGQAFTDLIRAAVAELGGPDVSIVDATGRRNRMWLLGPGALQDTLLTAACRQSLLVADGNHRVAAATQAGRGSLLALVTGGPDLRIGPINRALNSTGLGMGELASRWRAVGLQVEPSQDLTPVPGTVVVLAGSVALRVRPAVDHHGIDHHWVEQLMVEKALGLDPSDAVLRPLYDGEAPRPDAEAVILIAPVPLADVLAVHTAGQRMPRKATYFTPKPRSGLLLADLV